MIEITRVQTYLKNSGLYKGRVDGDFGPESRIAARALLKKRGVEAALWADSRLTVAVRQAQLADAGFPVGAIDGRIGPQFRHAIELEAARAAGVEREAATWRDTPPATTVAAPARAVQWPLQRDVEKFYGRPGGNQTTLILPRPMRLAWDTKTTIRQFSVHEKCHDTMLRCFERIADAYTPEQARTLGIDLFGGCLNVRRMRGGSALSMHSWGIAIDFDPERNQLRWGRDRARLARPDAVTFWQIWEDAGAVSLGRTANYDWMHVQFARP